MYIFASTYLDIYIMEFKQLEIRQEGSWIKRKLLTKNTLKTLAMLVIGSVGGFAYFYFTEGNQMDSFTFKDAFNSISMGAFFGVFITNSPCARGRC